VETSPDARTHNYTGTVADRLTVGSSYWENTFSITNFDAGVWGKGDSDLFLTPTGNHGNYFATQQRSATRIAGLSNFAFSPVNRWGVHHFKIGSYAATSREDGGVNEQPVNLLNTQGQLIERITFNHPRNFEIDDVELNFFAQDHWIISPH